MRAIESFFADRIIFSVKGIERDGFLTDPDPLEAEVKRAMIGRARTVALVADAHKFDERGLNVIVPASSVEIAYWPIRRSRACACSRRPASKSTGCELVERVCFQLSVRRDRLAEYRERHREVWPEMLDALRGAGWRNYSLFLRPDGFLIGYLECEDFDAATAGDGVGGCERAVASRDGAVLRAPRGSAARTV